MAGPFFLSFPRLKKMRMANIKPAQMPLLIALIIAATGVFGATSTRDAASLAAQCSAKDWDTYMNCQLTLLEGKRHVNRGVDFLQRLTSAVQLFSSKNFRRNAVRQQRFYFLNRFSLR